MLLLGTAESIMDMTRDFYAGHGHKSANKVYMKSKKDVLTLDEFEKRRTSFLVRMFSSGKANRRAAAMQKSGKMLPELRKETAPTPYAEGKRLWDLGQAGQFVSGNCEEMADVAAYLAISEFQVPADQVYIGMVTYPGDHVFCLAGADSEPDDWTCLNDMESKPGPQAYVIDPWLHVACHAKLYPEFAERMLRKWHREGKRVGWSGKDGQQDGWYAPSGTYAKSFPTAPLTFKHAR